MRRLFQIFLSVFAALVLISSCNMNSSDSGTGADPAYISEVFEYRYGPGQHAGTIGTAEEQMKNFLGTNSDYVMLGGWGGYIVAGFDHNVQNLSGYDFAVFTQPGVGSEPGVVYVMPDDNGNGLPDAEETWYEIAGSETGEDYGDGDEYIRNYVVTYSKPGGSDENITWSDNQDPQGSGELVPGYHPDGADSSDWWWDGYGSENEVTFTGVKLPDNMENTGDEENPSWGSISGRFTWGYAENYGADDIASLSFGSSQRSANRFNIDDAVDSSGDSVSLDSIRFIKVQTGVFQIAGWLNEISTEVSGAVDLHMLGE